MDAIIGKSIAQVGTGLAGGGSSAATSMPKTGPSAFADMMEALGGKEGAGQMIQPGDVPGGAHYEGIAAGHLEPADGSLALREVNGTSGTSTVVELLQDVNTSHMKMDQFYSALLDGTKQYSMQELMLIQAKIYQLSQVTEMCIKVTQEGVSSVKSTLNTQVQ